MKVAKLVTGILSMVLSIFILFQSCAAGMYNAVAETGEVSGTAGFLVALLLIAAGIVAVATRNSTRKGGSITAMILYLLGGVLGFANAGTYKDLNIWAGFCVILAILHLIAAIRTKRDEE